MTPGRYLKLRREAAGLNRDELPIPGLSVLAIERDARPPTNIELWALSYAFNFSVTALVAIARGIIPGLCRSCGCSEFDACVEEIAIGVQAPCAWVEDDLCSACVGAAPVLERGLAA